MPTFIAFNNGKKVEQIVGADLNKMMSLIKQCAQPGHSCLDPCVAPSCSAFAPLCGVADSYLGRSLHLFRSRTSAHVCCMRLARYICCGCRMSQGTIAKQGQPAMA
jgi:hypothetical protein